MKNYFLLSLFAFMAISCSSEDSSLEKKETESSTRNDKTRQYRNNETPDSDNEECIKCQEMEVGETFVEDGVTYTVVDDESLRQAVEEGWDMETVCTSHVTDMSELFSWSSFNGDISKWDVSSVTNMWGMFDQSQFNGDISKWDVSNVTDMFAMFWTSQFNGDISKWDVSNVTDMSAMFGLARFNGDISNWDVSKVTNMKGMFYQSKFNGDISNWDVSNVDECIMFSSGATYDFPKPNFTKCDY